MSTALFISGGWDGHEPFACTDIVAASVEKRGLKVINSDTLDTLLKLDEIEDLSVIIPNWTMGSLSNEQVKGLEQAVLDEVGIAGWHGGMGDAFRECTQFQFIVGGQFAAHPDNIHKYELNITDRNHPVTKNVEDFTLESEQYYMHTDASNNVLAETTFNSQVCPWIKNIVMPAVWTRYHGQSRVFYCSAGHVAKDFENENLLRLVTNGICWAAGELE